MALRTGVGNAARAEVGGGSTGVLRLGGGRLWEMLTGEDWCLLGVLSSGPGLQPVLRLESVGIADGTAARDARNAKGSAERDLAGTSRGPITFPNLLQLLVFLHRGSRARTLAGPGF